MNALFAAAKEVCDFMNERRWKFCVIGGLAPAPEITRTVKKRPSLKL